MNKLLATQKKIINFRNERNWAQFHDPKNLAEAISIEAGKLPVSLFDGALHSYFP